jgi:hypothetical protein
LVSPIGLVFDLYFNAKFTEFLLLLDSRQEPTGQKEPFYWDFQPPVKEIASQPFARNNPRHPFVALSAGLRSVKIWPRLEDGVITLFPQAWNDTENRRLRYRDKANFIGSLQDVCSPGWLRTFESTQANTRLELMTDPTRPPGEPIPGLFGMTWVFPWAPAYFSLLPNCMEGDGTFKIMADYTLEILHLVYANESLPVALAIFPSESGASYSSLFSHVDEILGFYHMAGLLNTIPLVSDQGSSLEKLAVERGLKWHLCHRHLIERAGASSDYGEWTARLLKCCSPEEFSVVADRVRGEMKAAGIAEIDDAGLTPAQVCELIRHKKDEPAGLKNLRLMLREHQVERWGRWYRFFCPTTSNAAESIHAKLNRDALRVETFLMRLRLVKKLLFMRFDDRNSDLRVSRRSSGNFMRKMAREKELGVVHRDQAAWEHFYVTLNTVRFLRGAQLRERWLFPDWNPRREVLPKFHQRFSVTWPVPDTFLAPPVPPTEWVAPIRNPTEGKIDEFVQSAMTGWGDDVETEDDEKLGDIVQKAVATAVEEAEQRNKASDEEARRRKKVTPTGGNPYFSMIGWDIVGCIGRRLPGKEVKPEYISRIFELGLKWRPENESDELTSEQEIGWRNDVRTAFQAGGFATG